MIIIRRSDSQSENSYSQRSLSFSAGGSVNVSFKNESNHEGEEKKKSYSMIALKVQYTLSLSFIIIDMFLYSCLSSRCSIRRTVL